ncbi:hypothetical protein HELRODRAFT_193262 [Helobdella robusta]|uniref:Galactose mutarotase n=1 Tax=Helobdella robusta TaxID=6412 RepID=T1FUT2_HELRO|nr:hypothetical protein HELRODRAFT_193262 [Helobdella robusta]ESN97325.1 hypothetical protein HELRODRAFT_193262 [Helobdella robusta]
MQKIWKASTTLNDDGSEQLELTYLSAHGEESFPGNLLVKATYKLDCKDDQLTLTMNATTDATTIVNLTNHAYFNLAGHQSASINEHKLQMFASHYLPKTSSAVPDGTVAPVALTALDFSSPKYLKGAIGMVVEAGVHGIDHNFCLKMAAGADNDGKGGADNDGKGGADSDEIRHAARLEDEISGRALDIHTNQPGMQIYTGNYLDGLSGKEGVKYRQHSCIALEPQLWPDAVHHANFPSMLLRAGEMYKHITIYKFSTK